MKPLDAKRYFTFQVLINLAILVALFIPGVFILMKTDYAGIGIAALIGLMWFLFFHVLPDRGIGVDCPSCAGRIDSNTPWLCGFCKKEMKGGGERSFLNKCLCGAEPKAYKCHHCGELIFLSEDRLRANFASCPIQAPPVPPVQNGAALRREEKEAKLHAIEMEELHSKQTLVQNRTVLGTKTIDEEISESFEKSLGKKLGRRAHARKMMEEYKERFKDSPEDLQDAQDAVDQWLREEL